MMKRRKSRIALDVMLTATLIFEMFYMYTGNFLHELVGALFFITLVMHMAISFKWIRAMSNKSRTEKGISLKQKTMLVMCWVIAVVGTLLLVSSLLISNVLGSVTGLQLVGTPYLAIAYLHTLFAYLLCGAAIIHVALHWVSLFNVMKIPYDASKRNAINIGISSVAAIGFLALGSTAARALDVLPTDTAVASEKKESTDPTAMNPTPGSNIDSSSTTKRPSRDPNAPQDSSGTESSTQRSPQSSAPGTNPSSNDNTSSGDSSNNGSSSTASGYCTLCSKHCPLTAPKCSKPYSAGLL